MSHILLVDDDEMFVSATRKILAKLGHTSAVAGSVAEARTLLEGDYFDLLMLDIMLPDGSGLQVLDACAEAQRNAHIALVTGHPSVKSVVKSLYGPNISYLAKPFDLTQLRALLTKATCANSDEHSASGSEGHYGGLVGESAAMRELYQIIDRVGKTGANVLIHGESGVGKELVAKAIHAASGTTFPFVATNCGAFSKELLGSELFGHEKGAFTGAIKSKVGLFERANGGTLFLDEITEMPIEEQPVLLRVLETQTITRVGGTEDIPVDCRVISATNRSVEDLVENQCLREDLYFRLAVFPIMIPPLRERGEDVRLLASHFLQQLNDEHHTQLTLNDAQLDVLSRYDWPGNVRELRHAIHRAYLMSDVTTGEMRLPRQLASPFSRESASRVSADLIGNTLEEMERKLIVMTLDHYQGNKKETAEALGISLKTLYNRLNQYKAVG